MIRNLVCLSRLLVSMLSEEYGATAPASTRRGHKQWVWAGTFFVGCGQTLEVREMLARDVGQSAETIETLGQIAKKVIEESSLDPQYVKNRLHAFASGDAWSSECERLARDLRWDDLAAKIWEDFRQLSVIMPEPCTYQDPFVPGSKTNKKGAINECMWAVADRYFKSLTGSRQYILSKQAGKTQAASVRQKQEKPQNGNGILGRGAKMGRRVIRGLANSVLEVIGNSDTHPQHRTPKVSDMPVDRPPKYQEKY